MAIVTMPQLGETVTEGTVGRWLKKEGEAVAKYDPLLEVETDKVASEIPSPFAGTLTKIVATEGTTVPVGSPVCEISEAAGQAARSEPSAQPAAAAAVDSPPPVSKGPDNGAGAGADNGTDGSDIGAGDGVRYSPAVRKLARERGVDLRTLAGSGKGGRVTAQDVLDYAGSGAGRLAGPQAASQAQVAAAAKPPVQMQTAKAPQAELGAGDTSVRVTQMRKTIAEHMVASKTTVPHAWSMVEADVTDLVRWREREKDAFRAREGMNLTYLPIVVLAVCAGLREFPTVNATWAGDHIILRKRINVGVAVEVEDGLVVPVVRDADHMSPSGLARRINELVSKARARKLTLEEMSEGTFTVDNTGALGSVASYPIINPPQAAIITMEAIVKRAWVVNDAIAIRSIMNLCLSLDHRVLDGAIASRFLQSVKNRLEHFSEGGFAPHPI